MKPCVQCGEPSEGSRCDDHKLMRHSTRKANSARWQRLSRRLRRLQPWCDQCGTKDRLQVDHIIPVSERPDLEYVLANLRILCASCNSSRGTRVTDDERATVAARIGGETPRPRPLLGSTLR